MDYWDTSALLKLYLEEADSPALWRLLLASKEAVATSTIATIEVLCVLQRKERDGELRSGGAAALYGQFRRDTERGQVALLSLTQDVHVHAEHALSALTKKKPALLLRSLDLVHVATALTAKSRLIVATDGRLRDAAKAIGLQVAP